MYKYLLSISMFIAFVPFHVNTGRPDYKEVLNTFSSKKTTHNTQPFMENVSLIELSDTKTSNSNTYRFFGVHERNQSLVNFDQLKKMICTKMAVDPSNAIQIIGDSERFSKTGTEKGRKLLRKAIDHANLVEYGFTGYKSDDGAELDINSFVNEYIDENPKIGKKVLANIVGHTPIAIQNWGTYGSPNIHNYVVVYNDYDMNQEPTYQNGKKVSGFTTFGNDVTMSDYLLQQKDGDKFICLEGGVQSFLQVINALEKDIPVTMVYNLRKPEREALFSASRYLKEISNAYENNHNLEEQEVENIFDAYEKKLTSIWDPNKADYKTKKELFETAMKRFKHKELYKKVSSLCTFVNANDLE